jgi:hypothetical protein
VAALFALTGEPLHFTFASGHDLVRRSCAPVVAISELKMSGDDPYEVWPAPMCRGDLASCLAKNRNRSDTAECGEPYAVAACGERPLPTQCGHSQAMRLGQITRGLSWTSESDAPFSPVAFPVPGKGSISEVLRGALHLAREVPMESRSLDQVLAFASQDRQDDTPSDRMHAALYRTLYRELSAWLDEAQVVRVGSVRIEVYFVGRDGCGNLVGVRTEAVET